MDKSNEKNKIIRRLQNSLKLGGFNIRRDLCNYIFEEFEKHRIDLKDNNKFSSFIKNLSISLEKQCSSGQSIEIEQVSRAVEICLNSGHDKNETPFSVIDAFNFPRFSYDPDKKLYLLSTKKSTLLSDSKSKSMLFIERYQMILQKTRRRFLKMAAEGEKDRLQLQTVDFVLTSSNIRLDKILILGSIIQVSEGKYFLEDPTGMVQLDLKHAKFGDGFFVENSFCLVNGQYEDKILEVSSFMMPPGEEYEDSRPSFGNLNYFGGQSKTPLKDSINLKEYAAKNRDGFILFFSDMWLDHPQIFEKLEIIFHGFQQQEPIAFVFLGNFISESHGSERMDILKKHFKQFGDLLSRFPRLLKSTQFVFVPGLTDPSTPHILPRFPLPSHITEDFIKVVPKAIFTTNPCRIQYCDREITAFRADLLSKMLQGTLSKPKKENISDCVAKTVINQAHLASMSLNAQPIHWDFDYTLRLNPLPDLVIIGDKSSSYKGTFKGCNVVNPGPFCENGFEFFSYTPFKNTVESCAV